MASLSGLATVNFRRGSEWGGGHGSEMNDSRNLGKGGGGRGVGVGVNDHSPQEWIDHESSGDEEA